MYTAYTLSLEIKDVLVVSLWRLIKSSRVISFWPSFRLTRISLDNDVILVHRKFGQKLIILKDFINLHNVHLYLQNQSVSITHCYPHSATQFKQQFLASKGTIPFTINFERYLNNDSSLSLSKYLIRITMSNLNTTWLQQGSPDTRLCNKNL